MDKGVQHNAKDLESDNPDSNPSDARLSPLENFTDPTIALYRDYAKTFVASLRKSFGDGPPDPEDVSQQAFKQLMERGDFTSIKNLKAFLWRTATNIILGVKRGESVRARHNFEIEQIYFPLKDNKSNPERIISVRKQLKTINEVLRDMPAKRRNVVILHRIEGLPLAEVGRRLGISRQNAAKHLARGVADLNVAILGDQDKSSL
ncbi:MAG: sigma-70 family RNA polymerase sigma factor [Pseudomonadota bacterium]